MNNKERVSSKPAILGNEIVVEANGQSFLDVQPKISAVVSAPNELYSEQNLFKEMPAKIIKRDGTVADFKKSKITKAVWKAMRSVRQGTFDDAVNVSDKVVKELIKQVKKLGKMPTVEQTQDIVEKELMLCKFTDVAKAYILYRELHSRQRNVHNLLDVASQINDYLGRADWKLMKTQRSHTHFRGCTNI